MYVQARGLGLWLTIDMLFAKLLRFCPWNSLSPSIHVFRIGAGSSFFDFILWFSDSAFFRHDDKLRMTGIALKMLTPYLLLGLCLQGYGHSLELLISSHSHSLWILVWFTVDGSRKVEQLAAVWLSVCANFLGWLLFSSFASSMNQCSVILTRALPCQRGPRNWPVPKQNAKVSESFPTLMVLHFHASFVATGQQPWWQQTHCHVDICSKKELFCPSFRMCCQCCACFNFSLYRILVLSHSG